MAGQAERLLGRFGRRYAAAVRVATVLPIGAIALLRASSGQLAATVLVVAVAVVWTCGHGWWLRRDDEGGTGAHAVTADVTVLLGVSLSVLWTDAVAETNTGWLRLLVTFACVTWQWYTTPVTGTVAALAAGGGLLAVVAAAGASSSVLRSHMWVLVMAVLSRVAWVLVTRAARRADRMAAEAEQARREAAVAAAVRAEERELVTSLHDTAATTLLMVGVGQVPSGADWLAPQARRDLAKMRSHGGQAPERADLVDRLHADLDAGHLTVDFDGPPRLLVPFDVAGSVAGAAHEALNNVRRHAGTDRATVRLTGNETELRVEVVDEGSGFAAAASPTRRGLRESVHGRMNRIGGTATITSAEGTGTVVRLEWRADE